MTVSRRLLEGTIELQVSRAIEQAMKDAGPHATLTDQRQAVARAVAAVVEREHARWLRDAAALPPVRIPHKRSDQ